jgi:RNA polymerase sigma factor (sigma-70 family)
MSDSGVKNNDFSATNWSVVLEAGRTDVARAAVALEPLCAKYWQPIYAFIRRRGSDHHRAEDLTQAFFAHLLEKRTLKTVDRRKGKFRSFMLASLTNFLTNEWDRRQTLKRGGGRQIVSFDEITAEELYRHEPVDQFSPEKIFERRWALTVIEQVFNRLENECKPDKANLFITLKPGLTGEITPGLYADWATALNMNEGTVKVALHRLRRRFGELLRSEIAYTVADPAEVAVEIRHLLAVISV